MTGKNLVVACIASGIAASPFCAYQSYCRRAHVVGSFDDWLVTAVLGGEGSVMLRASLIAGVCFGIVVGLLFKQLVSSKPGDNVEPPVLRTPAVATTLPLLAIAALLLICYNHTPKMRDTVVWPNDPIWVLVATVSAVGSSALMGLLNEFDRIFEKSSLSMRVGILCCWPIAMVGGAVIMAGALGCGLLLGYTIGWYCGHPIAVSWIGACLAVVIMAVSENIFWPIYFPTTRLSGKK